MVESPDWIERNRDLEQLQRQRRDLLVDRTPLHPEVQVVELQIARAQRELGTIPRQVPGETAPPTDPPTGPPETVAPPDRTQYAQRVETFHARKRQLQAAGENVERLAAQERQASEAALRLPRIEPRLAVAPEVVEGPNPPAHWPLRALLAASAAAAGVGMISHGTSIDPPLRSPADVRASLPIPVVATVVAAAADRSAHGVGRLSKSPHRVPGWGDVRWPWIVAGAW